MCSTRSTNHLVLCAKIACSKSFTFVTANLLALVTRIYMTAFFGPATKVSLATEFASCDIRCDAIFTAWIAACMAFADVNRAVHCAAKVPFAPDTLHSWSSKPIRYNLPCFVYDKLLAAVTWGPFLSCSFQHGLAMTCHKARHIRVWRLKTLTWEYY